jgi:CBS domain-containing protein
MTVICFRQEKAMATVRFVEQLGKHKGKVLTTHADASVTDAAILMRDNRIGCLIVLDSRSKIAGIVTERDILDTVVAGRLDPNQTKIEHIMSHSVVTCSPETSIEHAAKMMAESEIRHLPIVVNDIPLGMVSSRDIMAHELLIAQTLMQKQSALLNDLEKRFPGITELEKDRTGRIVVE